MDIETLKHLLALREVSKALIDGLKAAVYSLDKVEEISDEQRKSNDQILKWAYRSERGGMRRRTDKTLIAAFSWL
jgi:hypothetical protein